MRDEGCWMSDKGFGIHVVDGFGRLAALAMSASSESMDALRPAA